MVCLLILVSAFEFSGGSGSASAMLAGGAVADWRHGLWLNPALVGVPSGTDVAAAGCRPYGLDELTWGAAAVRLGHERWGGSLGASSLCLGRFRESDMQVVLAGSPAPGTWLGLGTHVLLLNQDQTGSDLTLRLDAGGWHILGRFALGVAATNLNQPRWQNDDYQPGCLTLSATWQPVDELLLAADILRQAGSEAVAGGIEFRLAPPICLRAGVQTAPLHYAGGLELRVGILGLSYAWRLHPQLKDTHVVGLSLAWR
ncbi:MAG: hypothetical protein ABIK37_06825 [candidate division WOR-3 bacterium]